MAKFRTYTVLLTVASEIPPSKGVLEDHIEQAFEEGTDRHPPYPVAMATVFCDEHLAGEERRFNHARALHKSLGTTG